MITRKAIDAATASLAELCDEDVSQVPNWLAYLGESLEEEIGEGWLYDLEAQIRERRERGGW